jgi:glycosyltransferase involved in cell wall biosynthesis
MMKKVLIISYYFPPCGGIGVLRCLKIAKYLRTFGWEPVIYTAEDAHYPSYDYGNFKDIPEGVTILRQPIFEPYTFYKKFTKQAPNANANNALVATEGKRNWKHRLAVWIRSNFFIPDARAFWIKPSVKFLLNYLKNNKIDAIFSDGPPHTNTMIAALLKEQTGMVWLADFQDPWTQVDYYQRLSLTKWADSKHRRLEQKALQLADKTTIVSEVWKKDLESIGAKNVSVLLWGYDEDDFVDLKPVYDKKLTLTHAGLLGDDRNPKVLFEAVAELAREIGSEFTENFEIQFIGQVDSSVKASYELAGIANLVRLIPQIERKEALQLVANSQILLLLLNQAANALGRIPGKFFEYLAVQRPVLCLGLEGSDVDKILQEVGAGQTFAYTNKEKIKQALYMHYQNFTKSGNLVHQNRDIKSYTNKNLTEKVAGWLDELLAKSGKI